MQHRFSLLAALLAMVGVALGAFGSHGLSDVLDATGRTATFQTAVQYHMYHALALFFVGLFSRANSSRYVEWAGYCFVLGILLFSGSLYLLAVLDVSVMGAVAPVGGTAFIAGWGCLALASWERKAR